ncbi:MAG: hypothetical protein E7504_04610 [Ruminococcus sp.]|nr:hypothetical protein [Ruminococcus sp.]
MIRLFMECGVVFMYKHYILRLISVMTAILLLSCSTLPITAADVAAPILKIERISVDGITTENPISVEVSYSENMTGFLANSFGIKYDSALILEDVVFENSVAIAHSYANNPELGIIWFSGASGIASDTANIATTEKVFTLKFSLSDSVKAGAEYPISFLWNAADQSPAYWYDGERNNIIEEIKNNAVSGAIHIFDPNAPKLNETNLEVSIEDVFKLSVSNYEGAVTWVSDNPAIADVKDGTVTALKPGSCKIYAMAGSYALTCSVLVTENAKYDISKTECIYIRNADKQVVLCCPPDVIPSSIKWISSNPESLIVEDGRITALKNGASTVYAIFGCSLYQTVVIVELQDLPQDTIVYGDVNLDGNVDILDAILLNRNIMGSAEFNPGQKLAADIYNDGKISTMDSLCILKYVVSLIDSVPVTPQN